MNTSMPLPIRFVRMHVLKPALLVVFSLAVQSLALDAQDTADKRPLSYRDSIRGVQPMDTTGLDPELASILKQYYKHTFGNLDNWRKFDNMRAEGLLHVPQGSMRFVAVKKKPDYSKYVLFGDGATRFAMSYDGSDAWQISVSADEANLQNIPSKEAMNFVRDASVAGHLLYPLQPGKRIELLGTTKVGKFPCYDVKVTLPGGQWLRYAIDMSKFGERRRTTLNAVNSSEEIITFKDYFMIEGIRFPYLSEMESGGKTVYRMEMLDLQVNDKDVTTSVFRRSSGANAPGLPDFREGNTGFLQWSDDSIFSNRAFGLQPGGETAFPDFKDIEVPSILDDIGKVDL